MDHRINEVIKLLNNLKMKQAFYLLTVIFVLTLFPGFNANAQSKKPKRHWSHRKKDAVIGGGAGAVTGAVVSKHHVKGAVIGGAAGAGAGYLIGKKKDKKPVKKPSK
jgi:YMGG-like Gly-zipper